jgi:hypothetical protein
MARMGLAALVIGLFICGILGEIASATPPAPPTRLESIPADAVQVSPESDLYPPVLHSDEWQAPVPMPGPVNTAGGEDSPFITPDGGTFLFFFTPDVRLPAQEQLDDGVSGLWWTHSSAGAWSEPERIRLHPDVALDGCGFLQGDVLWFCSARVGNYGDVDIYTAEYLDGQWVNAQNAGQQLNQMRDIGEFHLSADGNLLLFHWLSDDGFGGLDLWQVERTSSGWSEPVTLGPAVNSAQDETRPFLSSDGRELWFSGTSRLGYPGHAIYRSVRNDDGSWSAPDEIISSFAAEPTLDDAGHLYFAHHFLDEAGNILEADIYVAFRKQVP